MRVLAFGFAADADPEAVALAVRGAVGDGAGLELLAHLERAELPDPEQVLADPAGFTCPPRGDLVQAVLTDVVAAVDRHPTRERWSAAWAVLARAAADHPLDLVAAPALTLAALRRPDWPLPEALDALAPVMDLVSAAA